jgi:hypothetical protein
LNSWNVAHSTVIGANHIKAGTKCQDAHVVELIDDGQWVISVVCDGAGSAPRSLEGARHVSRYIADVLVDLVAQFKLKPPGPWINDFIIQQILNVRAELHELASNDEIKALNCTLVACLIGPNGGFSFHIGDGNIVGGYRNKNSSAERIELYHSLPENGEYANETYFITENDWVKHLRFRSVPPLDWFLCCSDGGTSLVMNNEKEIKQGFLLPVITAVFGSDDKIDSSARLAKFLGDPKADTVTGDDKTIVLACKPSVLDRINDYFPSTATSTDKIKISKEDAISKKPLPTNGVSQENTDTPNPKTHRIAKYTLKKKYLIGIVCVAAAILAAITLQAIRPAPATVIDTSLCNEVDVDENSLCKSDTANSSTVAQ